MISKKILVYSLIWLRPSIKSCVWVLGKPAYSKTGWDALF